MQKHRIKSCILNDSVIFMKEFLLLLHFLHLTSKSPIQPPPPPPPLTQSTSSINLLPAAAVSACMYIFSTESRAKANRN